MSSPTTGHTATTSGARDHARAQGDTVVAHMPTLPARHATSVPAGVDPDRLVWAETVAPGGYSHKVLAVGTTLRLADPEADACADVLLFRADQPWERLNVADTVKIQWQAYSSAGQLLLSDQARVLATVVSDSSGCHDALCGTTTAMANIERYGSGSHESRSPAGRELFVLAAAKHGLEPRDLPPSISFFKGVRVGPRKRPARLAGRLRRTLGGGAAGRAPPGGAPRQYDAPARPRGAVARHDARGPGLVGEADRSGGPPVVLESREGTCVPQHGGRA